MHHGRGEEQVLVVARVIQTALFGGQEAGEQKAPECCDRRSSDSPRRGRSQDSHRRAARREHEDLVHGANVRASREGQQWPGGRDRYDQAMTPKRPHRVAVLGLPSLIPLELGIATEVFGREPHYDVTVCAEGGVARGVGPGITVTTSAGLNVLREADTVIVPGYEDLDATLSAAALDALRLAHGRGARLVSICTGAFAVAAAGLLDGRHATTHWLWTDELQRRHPLVEVLPNRLFVDDGDILTSAGMTTGIDLCLHLIRRDHGAAAANSAPGPRRAATTPGRTGAVHRTAARRGHGRSARAASRLDAGESLPSARPRHARRARAHVSTNAHSSVPRGDRGGSDGLAHRCADRPSTRAAGDDHRADREHRPPHGPGRAGICSSGLPSAHRHLAKEYRAVFHHRAPTST